MPATEQRMRFLVIVEVGVVVPISKVAESEP